MPLTKAIDMTLRRIRAMSMASTKAMTMKRTTARTLRRSLFLPMLSIGSMTSTLMTARARHQSLTKAIDKLKSIVEAGHQLTSIVAASERS